MQSLPATEPPEGAFGCPRRLRPSWSRRGTEGRWATCRCRRRRASLASDQPEAAEDEEECRLENGM